jgi:hypothetical protein
MKTLCFGESDAGRPIEVECARPGEFNAKGGIRVRLTEEDLSRLASNLDPTTDHLLKVGHKDVDTDTPDYGRVTGLRYDAGSKRLLASVVPTPAGVKKNREEGFRRVSMEIIRRAGRFVFEHLSLLAAHRPAIDGLAAVEFAAAMSTEGERIVLLGSAEEDPIPRRTPAGFSEESIRLCARGIQTLRPDLSDDEARDVAIEHAEEQLETLAADGRPGVDPQSERLHLAIEKLMERRPELSYSLAAGEVLRRGRWNAA